METIKFGLPNCGNWLKIEIFVIIYLRLQLINSLALLGITGNILVPGNLEKHLI